MKFISLLAAALVSGRTRHPDEGVLHLEDDEAQRLIDDKVGIDVTGDFSADQRKDVPVEAITTVSGNDASKLPEPLPHQSEIAREAIADAPEPPKPALKGKASQE